MAEYRYNIRVKIFANVGCYALSPNSSDEVRVAINKVLEGAATLMIGDAEFVIEGGEITGVFDADWNELETKNERA